MKHIALDDTGSAAIEFVLVYPVALAVLLLAFTDAQSLQMRQLGVTLIARELSRGIEIGYSPREIAGALSVLSDDVGFDSEPSIHFEKTDPDNGLLAVSYKGQTYVSRLSIKESNPLWLQMRSDLGSSLPMFVGLVALIFAVAALCTDVSASRIADLRANDLASSMAIGLAGSDETALAERAASFAADWPTELRARLQFEVDSPDQRTTDVRLCYEFRPIWKLFTSKPRQACAERRARLLPSY